MKKYTSIFIGWLLLLSVTGYGQIGNCTIHIRVPDTVSIKPGQKIFLSLNGETDTAVVINRLASFTKQVDKPIPAKLMLKSNLGVITGADSKWFYLEKGIITVIVTDMDSAYKATIQGPPFTTAYDRQLRTPVDYYNLQIYLLGIAYNKAKKANSQDTTALKTEQDKCIRLCFQVPQTYIRANPGSSLSIVALNFLGNGSYPMTLEALEDLYNSLTDSIKNSEDGLKYAAKLQKLKEAKALRDAKKAENAGPSVQPPGMNGK